MLTGQAKTGLTVKRILEIRDKLAKMERIVTVNGERCCAFGGNNDNRRNGVKIGNHFWAKIKGWCQKYGGIRIGR